MSAEILRHKKRGYFLVSFLIRDPQRGGWRQAGRALRLDAAEMETVGLELLLEGLQRVKDGEVAIARREDQLGPAEVRNYSWVAFNYHPEEGIELIPLHREGGGHVGDPAEAKLLSLPVSAEGFWRTLQEVLAMI